MFSTLFPSLLFLTQLMIGNVMNFHTRQHKCGFETLYINAGLAEGGYDKLSCLLMGDGKTDITFHLDFAPLSLAYHSRHQLVMVIGWSSNAPSRGGGFWLTIWGGRCWQTSQKDFISLARNGNSKAVFKVKFTATLCVGGERKNSRT